jgi:hypothetical protein
MAWMKLIEGLRLKAAGFGYTAVEMLEADDQMKALIQKASKQSVKVSVSFDGDSGIFSILIGDEMFSDSLYQGECVTLNIFHDADRLDRQCLINLMLEVRDIWMRLFPNASEPEILTGIHIYRFD